MNYLIMRNFILESVLIAVFFLMLIVATFCRAAELSGPDAVAVGELTTVASDLEGDWLVVPAKGVKLAKDTGKKALYLSATTAGEFTIIFFGVEDGAPVLLQKALTVGAPSPSPDPDPTPSPTLDLTAAEREAAAGAFQAALDGIDSGEVRTPQGARATFKAALVEKVGSCTGGVCKLSEKLEQALDAWSESIDFSTLETTKRDMKKVQEQL